MKQQYKCSGCGLTVLAAAMGGFPHKQCSSRGRWVKVDEKPVAQVRLETAEGRLVGIVEVLPFLEIPDVVRWGERFFKLYEEAPPTFRECLVATSLTTPERCRELSVSLA